MIGWWNPYALSFSFGVCDFFVLFLLLITGEACQGHAVCVYVCVFCYRLQEKHVKDKQCMSVFSATDYRRSMSRTCSVCVCLCFLLQITGEACEGQAVYVCVFCYRLHEKHVKDMQCVCMSVFSATDYRRSM